MAQEMLRVVKPNGAILWFDFFLNNPQNPGVRGIRLREIRTLFPNCAIALKRRMLAPPLTRLLAPYSLMLCQSLAALGVFDTHYLGLIEKQQNAC